MKKFIKTLMSNSDDVSHKRLIAIISFIVLIVLAVLSAFSHNVDSNFIYLFGSLTGGESLLSVIDKFKKNE
jgi:hypothetical protein